MSCVASHPGPQASSVVFLLNCEYTLFRGCHVASLDSPSQEVQDRKEVGRGRVTLFWKL